MERQIRIGRDEFEVDPARQQLDSEHYDEGRGLIGGDPAKRPGHVRWQPIPEDQPYIRLIDISDGKRARLDAFLHSAPRRSSSAAYRTPRRSSSAAYRTPRRSSSAAYRDPLEIEIGFGSGEFLLGRAAAHPERRFLAFEVKRDLCQLAADSARERGLDNLWISDDDTRWALPQLSLAGQVDVIHVLYPDPWWKRRHQAKRLFSPPFVELVHDLLVPDGLLHVRSDVEGYARLIEQVVADHGGFLTSNAALAAAFDDDPSTRREAYCRSIQRPFWVLAFQRDPVWPAAGAITPIE